MMRSLRGILLPVLLAATATFLDVTSAKKDAPSLKRTTFDTEPSNIFYFDDSKVVLALEAETGQVWRTEDEGWKWEKVDDISNKKEPVRIFKNPYDNNVAVVLGSRKTHWITYDQGETWDDFDTEEYPSRFVEQFVFHATDPKKLLYATEDSTCLDCPGNTYYTEDGFKSIKLAKEKTKKCLWAVATDLIADGSEIDEDRIICVVPGKYNSKAADYRLVYSDNFFEDETEVKIDGQTISGFASIASVKRWLIAAAKDPGSTQLALYTSMDSENWLKAEFGNHHVEEDAYTLLESTNYSIQVDVQTDRFSMMGVLFSSNSDGQFFTRNADYTNRDSSGFVDFEKISNVQGVTIVNIVDNHEDVRDPYAKKDLKTKLSYDDGRTFHSLHYNKKELHLHSVTDLRNSGRVFSSPAPGLVMGIGNTGDFLKKYEEGDLFVSDDGGLNWELALENSHKYEFGDQGAVLVAVRDDGPTQEIKYSLKHGKDEWQTLKLEEELFAVELTTIPDSTSLRFILVGHEGKRKQQWVSYTINFEDMHERDCEEDDFETWHARKDDDGEAMCVMGRKQSFQRRKADAECFVGKDFKEPQPEFETCDCGDIDYECDIGFKPEWKGEGEDKKKSCIPDGNLTPPKGACEGDDETFKGSSGWRKIPGNECKGDTKKDEEVDRKCSETTNPPASGEITSKATYFSADLFAEYYYLERTEKSDDPDETIVMRTKENELFITYDHGKNWEQPKDVDDEVVAIYPHQYSTDGVFFITPSKKVHYSRNRGKDFRSFEAPLPPNKEGLQVIQFHPDPSKDYWLIWTGEKDHQSVSYVSKKEGYNWIPLLPSVKKCQFMYSLDGHDAYDVDEKLVYCEQFANEDPNGHLQLVSSVDWFDSKEVVLDDVVSFATMSEFIIVASKTEDRKNLKLDASIDGKTFADARFPPKFTVDQQQAYTVLDSSTHSVFLHVTVNARENQEYGTIIKSNSNGTSYVLSVSEVNRNRDGYVDFEKMQGLEGVAMINRVKNKDQVDGGANKEKVTYITHNDGADWDWLKPPGKDSKGHSYECSGECHLHLHGYTERADPRATFSSGSAVGLMMGLGNVGESLGRIADSDTFLTRDGGITWREAMKGPYMWEYGDQGSIIVVVKRNEATNTVRYTLDEGENWHDYTFDEDEWNIELITTVPSDTSMNFLLWGKNTKKANKIATVNLDFTGLFERPCELDDDHPEDGDYRFWSPKHPMQDSDCLFGHVAKFHRKVPGTLCYNGRKLLNKAHDQDEKCPCTLQDWECDYNYERVNGGVCQLVEGTSPPDGEEVCKNPDIVEWHSVTGYRKIPISTCEGGKNLRPETMPCPGHEEEYDEKHRTSGFVIFLAVILPIAAAAGVGYWVYKNWDRKFGSIRLGDGYGTGSFDGRSPWIEWPVAAVSGLVAILSAVPLLVGSLWRSVSGRFGGRGYGSRTYTSRSSFARGRGDYAIVDPDEGELLGEDSDDDA